MQRKTDERDAEARNEVVNSLNPCSNVNNSLGSLGPDVQRVLRKTPVEVSLPAMLNTAHCGIYYLQRRWRTTGRIRCSRHDLQKLIVLTKYGSRVIAQFINTLEEPLESTNQIGFRAGELENGRPSWTAANQTSDGTSISLPHISRLITVESL